MSIQTIRRSGVRAGIGALALGAIVWSSAATAATGSAGGSGVADLVEKVSPSVVTVFTTQEAKAGDGPQFQFPEGFEEFFERFGSPEGMPGPFGHGEGRPRNALGSGFVLEADGYIITNHHVVDGASEVKVRLTDEREFEAEVIGTDPETDLALLKVEAGGDLPHVTLGDSDAIRVGEDVVAVGNPFGLGGTVTRGIVSAVGRDINAGPYVDFIQTDAAINRGNSGGPLFDMEGRVIGVNSAIYSPNGGSVGVGFAVPSNIVETVVAQLKEDGSVDRGWLGVSIQSVTRDIAEAMGLAEPKGALVADVVADSPSEGTLRAGDVIVRFGGEEVADSRDLPRLVGATEAGAEVAIDILRDGEAETVTVKIGALPVERHAANTEAAPAEDGVAAARLGATVAPVTAEARRSLGLAETVEGAVVTSLETDGAAAKAGVAVGDVIVKVGGRDVDGPAGLEAALAETGTENALLLVNRRGSQIFLGVKLSA